MELAPGITTLLYKKNISHDFVSGIYYTAYYVCEVELYHACMCVLHVSSEVGGIFDCV